MDRPDSYLLSTRLCDFDRDSFVKEKAVEVAQGCTGPKDRFDRLCRFVKELPYGLEDWDVRASDTLRKGWGMCCGKTNLLVAMSRALLIPARYRVFKIKTESRLLEWVAEQHGDLRIQLADLPAEQDHLDCEAYLDGCWRNYDPARDYDMENGLRELGISLEREPVIGADGVPHFAILASIDEWTKKRQENRRFRDGRDAVFALANEQLVKIRLLGRGA